MLGDERLKGKVQVLDHHKTYDEPKYKEKPFIKVQLQDEKGLCCGTSLFYKYLQEHNLLEGNPEIDEFVELTRQHDTWEWRNIYNNEKSRELAVLFDSLGYDGYITLTTEKLRQQNPSFEFTPLEQTLIKNRKKQIEEKCKLYENEIYYKEILGMKAGILFIDYEYRNEIAEYFRQNNFDMDFTMMISLDRGVVCYRSVKPGKAVRPVAELFGGKAMTKQQQTQSQKNKNKKF
jgi:oligoribonuclease NrnB/cAMP/cGMP phosphodiesterase (DHH superfamily)